MVTDEQLKEWERLADAASEGPWIYGKDTTCICPVWLSTAEPVDAEFVSAARDAMPALIAEVWRLKDEDTLNRSMLAKQCDLAREAETRAAQAEKERDEARRKHVRCEAEWEDLQDISQCRNRTQEERERFVCDRFYGEAVTVLLFGRRTQDA